MKQIFAALLLALFLTLSGCTLKRNTQPAVTPELYESRAKVYEETGELIKAIYQLKTAQARIENEITRLEQAGKDIAQSHYNKGLYFLKKNRKEDAQREFLITLRYDPGHKEAFEYLKTQADKKHFRIYTVKPKDTLIQIARTAYKDSSKYYLIAELNNMDPKSPLLPGMVLRLPVIDEKTQKKLFNYKKQIINARKLFKSKKYPELIKTAQHILKFKKGDIEARYMINVAHYNMGTKLSENGRYEEAIKALYQVEPGFSDVKEQILRLNEKMALQEKEAIRLKNAAFYQTAMMYEKENRFREALETYEKIDSSHKDVKNRIPRLKKLIHTLAEKHYKKGIGHFINEDLTEAIHEWEKVLALEPNHAKARKDIDNARSLLEKVAGINAN